MISLEEFDTLSQNDQIIILRELGAVIYVSRCEGGIIEYNHKEAEYQNDFAFKMQLKRLYQMIWAEEKKKKIKG